MINLRNKKDLQKQKGVTLIEVLAVVIIGILITVGALTLYGNVQDKQNENATMTGIMSIQANVRDLFYGQDYDGLKNKTMISAGGIPSSFQVDGDEISHPLGGTVGLWTNSGTNSQFDITVNGIPSATCITMAGRNSGFIQVSIGDGETETVVESSADAVDKDACDGDDNTITYTSR